MLYCTAWFLCQDVAETGVSASSGAVGYGEVEACDVTRKEDGDIVEGCGGICGVGW